ncbi:MAG: molecular chaperone TorD family protein [Aquificaceae bacterium]
MEELKSLSVFYYAFSELFLGKDLYYINLVCKNLSSSDYSQNALNILNHINTKRLEEELEFLEREVSLLERDYRAVDREQLLKLYENYGFTLEEGYEPDHLGVEIRFLSLLCLEEDPSKAYINQYRFIHNRLDWLRNLEDALKAKEFLAVNDSLSFLRTFLRDHKAFLMGELKITLQD